MGNPRLIDIPSVNGLWSSIAGGPGVRNSNEALPVPLASALQGVLDGTSGGSDSTGVSGATPTDTRTKQQRVADDASGKVYNPATGDYTPSVLPSDPLLSLDQKVYDWLTGSNDTNSNSVSPIKKLLLLIVIMALGGGLVYFGIKTLAE